MEKNLSVKELEQQLEKVKKEEYIKNKTKWHEEVVEFINSVINKPLIFEYSNSRYSLYKIIKFRRCSWLGESKLEDFYELQTKGYYRLDGISILNELSDYNYTNHLVEIKTKKGKNYLDVPNIQFWNDVPYKEEYSITKRIGERDKNHDTYIGKIPPSIKEEFYYSWFVSEEVFDALERIRINTSQQLLDLYNKHNNKLMLKRVI